MLPPNREGDSVSKNRSAGWSTQIFFPVALMPLVLVAAVGLRATPVAAQQGCAPPEVLLRSSQANIFDDRQEADLGDAIAEHIERTFRVIDDDEIAEYLRRVGARLIKQLPPSHLRFQIFLIDLPEPTAFAIAGGRVYVSRKLVTLTQSEEELAGALAHELGHVITHQSAIDMTASFAKILGVKEAGDRQDIFNKYHRWIENLARNSDAWRASEKRETQEQMIADQIALYAMMSAGYQPQAFADFFDRLAETKGKTGSWISDFFGTTRPESKRLREVLKTISTLPRTCYGPPPPNTAAEFQAWQRSVIGYTGLGNKEVLRGVLGKKALDPPLEDNISHLRISPDGAYILAQNSSSIYVLSRDPLEPLFRVDAPDAFHAQFSPDSQSIVFHNASLHVERWSVSEEQRTGAFELINQTGCWQTALSPDGKTLACFTADLSLTLTEVATGKTVFEKKNFYTPASQLEVFIWELARLLSPESVEFVHMGFTPDAHYFAAARGGSALALDLSAMSPVSLNGVSKKLLSGGFAFLGPDRFVGIDEARPRNSALVGFPSGQVIDRLSLARSRLASSGDGAFVLVRPVAGSPLGVFDIRAKKLFMTSNRSAFDLHGAQYVSERLNGELGLYRAGSNELLAKTTLPRSPLGYLPAVAVSPDLRWLAVSGRDRGAVWNIANGERVFHLREFRGAYFGEDGTLYADFPKSDQNERRIGRLKPGQQESGDGIKVEDASAQQFGKYLVSTKPAKKDGSLDSNVVVEVRDLLTGRLLWSKDFPKEAPALYPQPRHHKLILSWTISSSAAKKQIGENPKLQQQLESLGDQRGDYLIQVLDFDSGQADGSLLLETGKGSFHVRDAAAAGDWVIVTDTQNRVLVYSLKTGQQLGRAFGVTRDVSKTGGLLCAGNGGGRLSIYDLASMTEREALTFSSTISHAAFNDDGTRLVVLTSNQAVYVLDVSELPASPRR